MPVLFSFVFVCLSAVHQALIDPKPPRTGAGRHIPHLFPRPAHHTPTAKRAHSSPTSHSDRSAPQIPTRKHWSDRVPSDGHAIDEEEEERPPPPPVPKPDNILPSNSPPVSRILPMKQPRSQVSNTLPHSNTAQRTSPLAQGHTLRQTSSSEDEQQRGAQGEHRRQQRSSVPHSTSHASPELANRGVRAQPLTARSVSNSIETQNSPSSVKASPTSSRASMKPAVPRNKPSPNLSQRLPGTPRSDRASPRNVVPSPSATSGGSPKEQLTSMLKDLSARQPVASSHSIRADIEDYCETGMAVADLAQRMMEKGQLGGNVRVTVSKLRDQLGKMRTMAESSRGSLSATDEQVLKTITVSVGTASEKILTSLSR